MKKRFSEEQKKLLKKYWPKIEKVYENYADTLSSIENIISKKLDIDILIHIVDGEPVGYGDWDRNYELWHMPEGKYMEEL